MPSIHVCSLPRVEATVAATGAKSLVTLLNPTDIKLRPEAIAPERHLFIRIGDIVEPQEGLVFPEARHVRDLIAFARKWDRREPMVVHCFAGVSRSTASAFIATCALLPERDEAEIAREIRASSPTATPNSRLVALADHELGRQGRMSAAIAAIGRGIDCDEGVPFALHVG